MIRSATFICAAATGAALALGGCAAPRTAVPDATVHRVVIVTALDESGIIDKRGLTVFGNDATTIPQDGAISRTAVDEIAQRLHRARPNWEIVPAGVDLVAIGAKDKPSGYFQSNDALAADVAEITKRTGADAVFLVTDTTFENSVGRGVGVMLHKLPGMDARVFINAHVLVERLDKSGQRIDGAAGGQSALLKASDFDLTGEITSVDAPGARAKLSEAMRNELRHDLDAALERMGY